MTPRELNELLDRHAKGKCSPSEQAFVNQWFNSIGKNVSDETELEALQSLDYNKEEIEARLWNKLNPGPDSTRKNRSGYFLRVAATILVLAVAIPTAYYFLKEKEGLDHIIVVNGDETFNNNLFQIVTNSENHPRQVELEDGTMVTLQSKSQIRFANKFKNDRREVYLTGEAFFNVKRDEKRPFFVYSDEVITKVLGTSFNIKAYIEEKEVTVAVKTGKVSVYTQGSEGAPSQETPARAVILTPNQKVVYNRANEKVLKQLVEKPEIILPEPTLFKMAYEGAPVTKIFDVLEENYGIDIEYDEEILSGCVLTTTMSDEGLYERIEVICKAINAEYTITDAVIKINSRGCI